MTQKTISSAQLSLGISSHNNHYLFSDHYLNNILKTDPRWREAIAAGEAFLQWVTAVYQHEHPHFTSYSEAQLEENWFRPIFRRLGHTFEGQAKIPGLTAGVKYPDYVFFPDDAARQRAAAHQQTPAYVQEALAVGEVKKWDVPLGKKSQGTPSFENNNPSYQIDYYLRATDLSWGVLSNGRLWRLVHKESSYKLDVYFEIDLAQAIAEQNRAAAIFFVLFFGQGAFLPDGHGRRFLQDALTASAAYTLELENDLRDNAYKALEHLIQGFIEPQANGLTAADLPAIYTNSLYLLYRIIFLFYGESRGLLPLTNQEYQKHSLTQFARDVAARLDAGYKAAPMTDEYWSRLKRLFTIINGNQPDLNAWLGVPRYNGGLFSPDLHPFLERYFVGDRYLLAAIDVLARREVGQNKAERRRENVDYRTLGVRQLGSIYEGLLEYRPQQATGPMVAVKKGKGEEWLPTVQKPANAKVLDTRHVGDVYLVTDKGERKATGSYYTPDYIVKYIVEQTLGPLVAQIRSNLTGRPSGFAREILQLNVLDPAMGSGHFLVEATDYLARAIATDEVTGTSEVPVTFTEDDLVYWRRQVVEACIYGVDKNPMAVELAKLSLWLVTVAGDKPLSFLDHHLRHGDSLVGARLADLNSLPTTRPGRSQRPVRSEQPPLLDEGALTQDAFKAVGGMMAIEGMLSDSIEDIHHKERLLAQLEAHLAKWRRMADLWTSHFFGNTMSPAEYADLLRTLQSGAQVGGTSEVRPTSMLNEGQRQQFLEHPAVTDNDYFHWELAFPELFFDEYGRHKGPAAGFDAIIGNPPYVRQEQLKAYKPFFAQRFTEVYAGTADLFVYFFKQAIDLLRQGGLTSYISSNSWLRVNYATNLRAYLREQTAVQVLIDLGDNRIFADAPDVYPAIPIVLKNPPQSEHVAITATFNRNEGVQNFSKQLAEKLQSVAIHNQPDSGWQLDDIERKLAEKLSAQGETLEQAVKGQIYRGLLTGLNDAFIIPQSIYNELVYRQPESAQIIKPMLRGANLRPGYQAFEGEWLIAIPSGWTSTQFGSGLNEAEAWMLFSARFPAVGEYLLPYADRARKRQDKGEYWWELRACAYYDAFERPKIMWPDITKFPRFSWDSFGYYLGNTGYILVTEHKWLLAYLASRCVWYLISKTSIALGERAGIQRYRLIDQYMRPIPVPDVPPDVQKKLSELAESLTNLAKSRYQLHQQVRHRIQTDLGTPEGSLNNALTAWWELAFPTFRAEVQKTFKRDIPLKERHDWENYLADAQQQHQNLTAQIIAHETALNNQVYALFHLTPAEIQLIEASTKYPYGAV